MQDASSAGATMPGQVMLQSANGAKLTAGELASYRGTLAAVPVVAQVSAPFPNGTGTVALYSVTLNHDPSSSAAIDTVKVLPVAAIIITLILGLVLPAATTA